MIDLGVISRLQITGVVLPHLPIEKAETQLLAT